MKRAWKKIDNKFRSFWKNYVFQSLSASLAVFIVLLLLSLNHAVIVVAVGATAFIIFAMPDRITARPRNVIGGYAVGIMTGVFFSFLPHHSFIFSSMIYSLSVGVSIFIMVLTDTEHPPASGIALGLAVETFSPAAIAITFMSAVVLSAIKFLFRKKLRDLI